MPRHGASFFVEIFRKCGIIDGMKEKGTFRMSHFNSQEQAIYRSLAGRIQLGFYDDGEKFPSVQEIAACFQVSGCPAQRALKALERDGLIRLCRGKETAVLAKPYENFLESPVFVRRAEGLADLAASLKLISMPISFQGIYSMGQAIPKRLPAVGAHRQGKILYRQFEQVLRALGSRTVLSLYFDIGAFNESAFLDIVYEMYQGNEAALYLDSLADSMIQAARDCQNGSLSAGRKRLEKLEHAFFETMEQYLRNVMQKNPAVEQEAFFWEPSKGRTKYCDVIAVDMLRKINQGVFPEGTLLPNGAELSDVYHVSEITIRRTIALLNRLGVAKTRNGVGTAVISKGNQTTVMNLKQYMADENFKAFLEALQLLVITCETVIPFTFSHCPQEVIRGISQAAALEEENTFTVSVISACLQAVVHCCPLAAIREIYGKITLLLLNGSVLQLNPKHSLTLCSRAEHSKAIQESLEAGDHCRFAAAFRELARECFLIMKKQLLDMGVSSAEKVSDPAPYFSI